VTKVFLWPTPNDAPKGTGIGRIVHAQYHYLPKMGMELVSRASAAEVMACHTQRGLAPRVDVLHVHGMYFQDIAHEPYTSWNHHANGLIASAAREALVITSPSRWVAEPFMRDMRLVPEIIGHGVELEEWSPAENGGYILWNKSRNLDVCDPTPAYELAHRGYRVHSTFPPLRGYSELPNFRVVGHQPWEQMKETIRRADVYLATTRETFGVGTLEAMACGIPVLGYRWGGTQDIVRHMLEGYLANPGDVDDLERGWHWLQDNREKVGQAALKRAKEYSWERCMQQYADLYARVAQQLREQQHRVAVVIPCHNYGSYLKTAVDSVLKQSHPVDEVIVVDDGSTDDTKQVVEEYLRNGRFKFLHHPKALGVAAARNHGVGEASSEYVICLDADDWLDPRYVEFCLQRMKERRDLGVVYTGLDVSYPTGSVLRSGWPPPFSWETQTTNHVPPNNCVPSAAMFRRSMWERSGGYLQQYAPGEDAEFWTKGLALGFDAQMVDDMPLFHYRVHSKSASRTKTYVPINEHHPWMIDRQFPLAAPSMTPPELVLSYADPLITVILQDKPAESIEVVAEALEDLLGQTFRLWEVVIYSQRNLMPLLNAYPFARRCGTVSQLEENTRGQLVLQHPVENAMPPDMLIEGLRTMIVRGVRASIFQEGRMGGCCGGEAADPVLRAKVLIGELDQAIMKQQEPPLITSNGKAIRMEFVGIRTGAVTYHGRDGRTYRGGNNPLHKFANVHPEDAPVLISTGSWRTVAAPPAPPVEATA
jgi:GT2 family glycosyltransferase